MLIVHLLFLINVGNVHCTSLGKVSKLLETKESRLCNESVLKWSKNNKTVSRFFGQNVQYFGIFEGMTSV